MLALPLVGTGPTPWSMKADVPPVLVQVRTVRSPGRTAAGIAKNELTTGAATAPTATLRTFDEEPLAFAAVSLTLYEPAAAKACVGLRRVEVPPSPNSQSHDVGLPVERSLNETVWPATGAVGEKPKSATGAGGAPVKVYGVGNV